MPEYDVDRQINVFRSQRYTNVNSSLFFLSTFHERIVAPCWRPGRKEKLKSEMSASAAHKNACKKCRQKHRMEKKVCGAEREWHKFVVKADGFAVRCTTTDDDAPPTAYRRRPINPWQHSNRNENRRHFRSKLFLVHIFCSLFFFALPFDGSAEEKMQQQLVARAECEWLTFGFGDNEIIIYPDSCGRVAVNLAGRYCRRVLGESGLPFTGR